MRRLAGVAFLVVVSTACGNGNAGLSDEPITTTTDTATSQTTASRPTTTTTTRPPTTTTTPQEELAASMARAGSSSCSSENVTRSIVEAFGDQDVAFDQLGIYGTPRGEGGPDLIVLYALIASRLDVSWWSFTTAEGEIGELHSLLFFNHQRGIQSLGVFIQAPEPVVVAATDDLEAVPPVEIAAVWDAFKVEFSGGDTFSFPANELLRNPDQELALGQEARILAWEQIDEWVSELSETIDVVDWRALQVLEGGWLSTAMVPVLCATLATEWQISDELASSPSADQSAFFREIAIQELLLATEYLEAIEAYMSRPEIDWWRAPDVDESQNANDGVTSSSEYVVLWKEAALDALNRYRIWVQDAQPLSS